MNTMELMEIFLIGAKMVPYFEEQIPVVVEELEKEESSDQGPSRWKKLKLSVYSLYKKSEAKFPLKERLCASFYTTREIKIYYPAGHSLFEATKAWEHYLLKEQSRQRFWTYLDLLLSGLGGLMMPLPGPNVFFYYPAVRTFSHYRAWKGATRGNQLMVTFSSNQDLQELEEALLQRDSQRRKKVTDELVGKFQLAGLPGFLEKKEHHD